MEGEGTYIRTMSMNRNWKSFSQEKRGVLDHVIATLGLFLRFYFGRKTRNE